MEKRSVKDLIQNEQAMVYLEQDQTLCCFSVAKTLENLLRQRIGEGACVIVRHSIRSVILTSILLDDRS